MIAHVALNGDISEDADAAFLELDQRLKGFVKVVFDCDKIRRINSAGVGRWRRVINDLKVHAQIEYRRCPEVFIDYLNLLPQLGGELVSSFYVPYFCEDCGHSFQKLLHSEPALDRRTVRTDEPCPSCASPTKLAVDPNDYFDFLENMGR